MKMLLLLFLATLLKGEDAKPSILQGDWRVYETEVNNKKILVMTQFVYTEEYKLEPEHGHFMRFLPDGTYSEYASAQCGMDDNHFHYKGQWSFQNSILTFSNIQVENDRPNIYHKYSVRKSGKLKFLSQNGNVIRFEIVRHWEKRTQKR